MFPTTHVKRYYGEHLDRELQLNEEKSMNRSSDNQDSNVNKQPQSLSINTPSLPPPRIPAKKSAVLPISRSSSRIIRPTEKARESRAQENHFRNTRVQLCINLVQNNEDIFAASRQKELRGLREMNVFEPIPSYLIPQGTRIFGSRFVDEIKMPGSPKAYPKSRLVVQAFKDGGKGQVLTQSPTLQRVSQCILLSVSASLKNMVSTCPTLHKRTFNRELYSSEIFTSNRLLK